MEILSKIIGERRTDIEKAKKLIPVTRLEESAKNRHHHSLIQRLKNRTKTCIIAELKKASPSAGIIREEYNPLLLAQELHDAGATALSILTEPKYFLGSGKHLQEVRANIHDIPILRKDFICDEYQITETASWGADIILLIASVLDRGVLKDFYSKALSYGLEVLVEVHTLDELLFVLNFEKAIIGINNRNLKTFRTDLSTTMRLLKEIPDDRIVIAESGISKREEIVELEQMGCDGFLIGEAIMRAQDIKKIMYSLMGI
jgi:indole-3-glycerol phosphate synthase